MSRPGDGISCDPKVPEMRPPRTYWTVLLLLTLALAIAAASSLAQTDPPASGDWTVSDATLVENRTVDLRGDLIVRSGGELDLRNVTLRVHSTVTVVHGITVEAGGRLVVEDADGSASTEGDRSFIVRGAPSFGFSFVVEQGASLRINRSVVQGAGQVGGSRGVLVRANDTVLRSATFLDGHEYGLRVEATSGLSVRNCIFSRSHDGLVLRDVRNASVVNSVCSDNDRDGILLYNVTDSIIDHTAAQDNSLRGMEVTNCRNVTLSNLFVASNPWGLVLTRVKDLRVEASTVNDTSFSAVILEGPSSDVELTNCTIHSSQRTCVEGSDVLNLTLRGCWLENATYHGIHFLEDMDGLLIERCTIVRNGYDGVSIAKAEGVTVTDCAISDNGYNGVNMIECEDVVISGNILESNNYEGINCDHVTGLFLGNITVRLSRLYNGIKLQADTNNVTIVSCTLANNSRSGINLDAAHNVTVVDCNVSGNALSGVKVEAGSYDIWLENNTHWMNAMEGLLVEASWNVTMEGGAVDAPAGPLVNAIYVSRGGVVWLLNVTLNGGVRVSSAGNTTVVDEQLGSYTRRVSADSQLDEAVWTTVHVLWPDLTPVRSARVFANSSDGERSAFALTDVYGTVEHLPVTVQSWNGTEAIDRNPVTFRAEKGEEATSEQRTLLARTVVTIILLDDRPPIARALDVDAELGFEATFDGTASYDNGDIASWEWTFDDGIGVVQLQGAMATWTFLRLGTFAGTLNVTDSVGLWNETALNITVVDTTVPSVDLGDLISVDQHTTVDLDARGTEDNDPLLLTTGTFSWTIYRVGQEGEPIATLDGPLETWTFDDIGSYLVVLDVTDQSGNSANGSLRLAVLDIDPPIVELGPDRLVGQGTAVVLGFEVLEDNDPNFTLNMKVTWSISGPGLELNLTGPMPEFTPEEMGEYTVTVTVEDPSGNSAGDKIKVTARDTHPPHLRAAIIE